MRAAVWLMAAAALAVDPSVRFREAMDAQKAGRLAEAEKGYSEVLRLRPDLAEVHVNYGIVLSEQRRFAEAAKALETALALKKSLTAAHLFLGIARYNLNQVEPAREALAAAVQAMPKDPQARMWLGLALNQLGRTAEAAAQLDKAAELAPDNVDVLYHRGRMHLKLSQDSYRAMFRADRNSVRVHQVLAQSFEEAGRDEEAIAEYQLVAKKAPGMPGVHEALGSLLWRTGRDAEAEAAFARELENDPSSVLTMYKLGALRFRRGDTAAGMPLLEAAVRQAPDLIDARYYLGKAQAESGQNEAALDNLKRVVDAGSEGTHTESAWYQLAQIYRKLGRSEESRTALEHYRKLRSERDQARADKLESLKKSLPE